ncbi:hypothetical protein Pyn_32529 [Prunus yedoensis var. nudiflora]|uniref:G protein gamma domain-containing protein n=1 Tax=Prunus yedoensis var. nudiflora TaxID=2094558 RepID=A0A314V1P7_PRUYE|nr:hypothetical protein Pyn_32529 [Prunus yedoensis var. nudiflora]
MSFYSQNNFDLNTALEEQILLALRSDSGVVNDSLVASMQYAASVTNLGQWLLARSQEVEALRSQVIILRRRLNDADKKLRRLEKSNKKLEELVSALQVHEENTYEEHKDSPTDAQILRH